MDQGDNGGPGARPIRYCLVPRDLAARLHEPLRHFYADDPSTEVIVERRARERRAPLNRRMVASGAERSEERRLIRGAGGRRAGESRAALVPVEGPELPRRARRYAGRLVFVERVAPSSQHAEDLDTARLIVRIQSGEEGAFGELYLRYFDRVYNYVRVILRDRHEAEDLTQQAFLKAFQALPDYESRRQPFRGWLFTIVRNTAISQMRKQGRIDVEDPDELNRTREEAGESDFDLGLDALSWVSDRDLLVFIDRLPPVQRQVLGLRYMLDLTTPEICQVLGRTPNDVRKLQHRALRFLEDRLRSVGRVPSRGERRSGWNRRLGQLVVLRERRHALRR